MNELGLTHIESLDSEIVHVPGLDVDGDFEKTVTLGKSKLRNRRLIKGASAISALSFFAIALFGISQAISAEDGSVRNGVIQTAQKQFDNVQTNDVIETPAEIVPAPATNVPPATNPAPVIDPKLISIKSFGNAALCNIAPNPNPGPGEVVIGPSSVQTWNPSIGQSRVEVVPSSGRQLVLRNIASNNATNAAYVDLVSGFDSVNSFADITTLGFKYCESGYALEITPRNGSGYAISITSL